MGSIKVHVALLCRALLCKNGLSGFSNSIKSIRIRRGKKKTKKRFAHLDRAFVYAIVSSRCGWWIMTNYFSELCSPFTNELILPGTSHDPPRDATAAAIQPQRAAFWGAPIPFKGVTVPGEWTSGPVFCKGTSSEKECDLKCAMLSNPWKAKTFILPLQLLSLGETCQIYDVGKNMSYGCLKVILHRWYLRLLTCSLLIMVFEGNPINCLPVLDEME